MNKVVTADDVVGEIRDGATIAIGGSSLSRKPMALVRALARSDRRNLRLIVNVGGPEVDLLIGTGKIAEVIFAFVGFEVMGLAPHFRRARQDGSVRFQEWTEFTVMAGLDATIKRVPFLPTHAGLGTDLLRVNAAFRTFQDPFEGQTLLAVPALRPDVALIHVNLADPQGNGVILGDGHIDGRADLAAGAAADVRARCTHPAHAGRGRRGSALGRSLHRVRPRLPRRPYTRAGVLECRARRLGLARLLGALHLPKQSGVSAGPRRRAIPRGAAQSLSASVRGCGNGR